MIQMLPLSSSIHVYSQVRKVKGTGKNFTHFDFCSWSEVGHLYIANSQANTQTQAENWNLEHQK